jgi:autotransporter-associated beta strand protein
MKKFLLPLAAAAFALGSSHAANVTWSGGNGTWQNATQGGFDATYNNGDNATFLMSGTPSDRNIDLVGVLAPANLTVTNPGATTLPLTNGFDFIANATGESIAATGNLTLNSASVAFQNTASSGTFTMANTVGGNLLYTGGNILALPGQNASRNATLTVTGNLAAATAGNTLLFSTEGTAVGILTVSGTKPSVTNGMTSAGIQYGMASANVGADFATFSGNDLASASAAYTNYAASADWSGATNTTIVNFTGAPATLTGSGALDVYAVRSNGQFSVNLGGRQVNILSGGLITGIGGTWSNGTFNFGSGPGFIGAYNASGQTTISANLAGSGGITVMGNSQALKLASTTNTFTNGLYVNGGRVSLDVANAANNNDVTVNAFGELTSSVEGSSAPAVIGGLSGTGAVRGNFQGNNTKNYYLRIAPASGSYTFDGTIGNGIAGGLLHISKNGTSTQIFGTNSVGSYTGTTTVNAGTLIINGNFSAATGAVSVASGAILGGNGTIGGATTVDGTIAAGNSIGVLSVAGLTLNATSTLDNELGRSGSTPVSDRVNVTGSVSIASGANLKLTLYTGLTAPVNNDVFFVLSNDGVDAITGVFTKLNNVATTLNEGSQFTWNSQDWKITYQANFESSSFTGGNDIALQVVPEPATWALLAFSLTTVVILRRRRQS